MKRTHIILIFLTMLLAISISIANAGEPAEVELVDGSVVYGEIVSLKNGVYTIDSDSMGTITINKSKIRAIRFKSHDVKRDVEANLQKNDTRGEIQDIQKALLGNEDILNIILSLQDDPKVQEILKDPDVMNSVQTGDIQSLMSNPKFMELLNHPKFKAINKKMAK